MVYFMSRSALELYLNDYTIKSAPFIQDAVKETDDEFSLFLNFGN